MSMVRWEDPADDAPLHRWRRADFFHATAPFRQQRSLRQFSDCREGERVGAAYGSNYASSRPGEARYDPENSSGSTRISARLRQTQETDNRQQRMALCAIR